ncbi:hypothetical protein PC113_g10521 [Phytophthora cactorum]|uniref:Chorein N-terminal domain-containing protein n=1 Tax=Phytophthora cactorum TaxID=29920 RepID=A0A8T0Z6X5_9STRA|nr:hypothetical protein PC113_g10521 [Phytophthora cactorum]
MLDLLSPLRGYIAQNLQFYLSKYIEDIQLEGLGLFGGDLVLNDLEIKRHVLRESLEIPSSFDFSRGFIRELRIHIPWTQLLSQPIEVKLYTIELILTGKSNTARAASLDASVEGETEIDQPKSGWIHDMLQRILANVSVQINNLVLKYEHDDVVFSIALGTLDFYSASETDSWKRSFEELKGGRRAICKRIDAKDVTIFLDRYTSDGVAKEDTRQNPVRRKVVGYEVPVLSRTSASIRAKLQLFPSAVVKGQGDQRSKPTSPTSPLHQQRPAANGVRGEGNIIDVDGLFAYRPSVTCDPFYYYSCNRSSVTPMYEVDVFIGELFFSVSDRQLEMLNQLIQSASRKIDQAHELHAQTRNCGYVQGGGIKIEPTVVPIFPAVVSLKDQMDAQKDGGSKKQESWFGWAMNALGATEDEEEDKLVSELLAETRGALLKGQSQGSDTDEDILAPSGPVTKTSCVRVCISSASLTLRKHETETQPEHQDFAIAENGEEFVPVANLGMVKVVLQTKKKKVARPAVPILHLTLSYVALEMLLARGQEQSGTDLVFEVEKVELVSATTSENREDLKCKKGEVLLTWGSIDSSHFSDCVSHPYFINSFFGEETTRLNQRESRSFEIVKVSLDSGIPIWKTLDDGRGSRDSDENSDLPCDCFTTWNGESVRCIPITTISRICHHTIRMIGIKERVLDEGILSNAVSTAWALSGIPISVSEEMARTLTSTADEYRAHRNPDIGALDNLAQLLQPQLGALFSRYTLHSCSAASLHPSPGSSNIRHRSVHSALRMRSASTSNFTERDVSSPDVHLKEETVSKVLDISIGAAQAVLEPPKCLAILEALSIFQPKNEDDDNKAMVKHDETPTPANENVVSSTGTITQSDIKLITVSKVHILLPGLRTDSGQDSVGLLLLSVSSVEKDTRSLHPVKAGGELKLVFATKGATLCASKSGTLAGLKDSMVLRIEDVGVSVDFSHEHIDCRHNYVVDATLHVSRIKASLSRLKLLYLLKLPFIESEAQSRKSPAIEASHSQTSGKREEDSGVASRCQWHWRLGAQLDRADFSCTADIYHRSSHRRRQIRAVVHGKVLNFGVAARIGNYHPTKNHLQPSARNQFTDIQVSVGDIQVVERLQNAWGEIRTGFGDFSCLPEHAFMGILVCLDLPELKCLSETFRVSNASMIDQQSLPSAMLSWHLTSSIAKMFQELNAAWLRREAARKQPIAEIPLIVTWNDPALAKTVNAFPLLSGFYRNYSEAGLPCHVIAGSMENVDIAVTTSSLYCLASVLNVRGRGFSPVVNETTETSKADDPGTRAHASPDAVSRVSLADVEVSVLFGQVRLILPNESLMDSVLSKRSVVPRNVVVVLESMSMVSAVRNDISLDGLGYPPFNSRILPRRPTLQAQRFGQSQLRIGCRAGKISGFVADLEINPEVPTPKSVLDVVGPFEEYIGCVAGYSARFVNVETFWSPLNVTCSVTEESLTNAEGSNTGVKTAASIGLTKLRLDLHKPLFDVLVTRVAGVTRGIESLRRSITAASPVKLTPIQLTKSPELFTGFERKCQREVAFSCDGIEINVIEMSGSTHIRVGSIMLGHNSSTLSGSASIQNLAVGHRTTENPISKTVEIEEVVFGANTEPSLWQLAVENYPEKLIAARWSFGDRSEGTLFLDVQAYQLHVSHHFIQALAKFSRIEPDLSLFGPWEQKADESSGQPMDCKPFVLQQRWNIKVLVAPSVMSYWRQNATNKGKSGVWMTSGQLFASVAVGTDEVAQQSLSTYGPAVHDIDRFVAVPTLEMMLNMDKFGVNTSDDLPPLEVHFQRDSVGPVPTHTSSTWQRFSKYISGVSEAQRLLHDCSVRVTGDQHQMLERVAIGEAQVCLLYTDMARTNIQAEVNALCVKLSSFSLGAIQSLLSGGSGKRLDHSSEDSSDERYASEIITQRSIAANNFDGSSTDDFKNLRRMAEGRRPLPGELVFTESLLIETQSVVSGCSAPVADTKVQIQIDPNKFDIEFSDVAIFLEDCNKPWEIEGHESSGEGSPYTGLSNKTHSWMGMRWCYHIPRKVCKIVANPVPIPPNGVPSGWPSWNWNQDQEGDASRLCDIRCQLRCWNSKKSCFAVVCEFYVPWDDASAIGGSDELEGANEPGSFGDLMSQWFDDDMEETRYRARLLEFGARTRTYKFENELPSDNWELRWRAPLQSEQEPENKQKRLVVNALLASSLQVHSVLTCDAYQRVVSSITLPQVTLSVSHVGSGNDSHDVVTTELNDTEISCAISGSAHTRTLNVRVSSALQVYLDNMIQLLTVSVIPRTTIDAMVEASSKGIEVSTLVGPVSMYLNQTAMLVISAIPKLLQTDPKQSPTITGNADERMSSMRIRVVNHTGVDIWYRQEGTTECLLLSADASSAYSWLSLASNPFYQLCFAMDDPREKLIGKTQTDSVQPEQEDPPWCDPCRIKENGVTGRYFGGHGFVWICVELSGLKTTVTLRSSLTVRNYCKFPVRVKVNKNGVEHGCARSEELYRDAPTIRRRACYHPNCVSLDGSACTLSTSAKSDGSVARIMAESVTTVSFGIDGGSWSNVETQGRIPSEFDLVKISDNEAEFFKKAQCKFTVLHPKSPDEHTQYAWAKVTRVQCKTVLPTDFDPLQPHLSGRYTWMEMSLWPAITVENVMDIPVALSFSQKLTTINLEVSPASEKSLSTINPFEPVDAQLQYGQGSSSANTSSKPMEFLLQCSSAEDSKEQIFVFEGCKVVVSFCNDHRPMIRIRTERILGVANMTPSDLIINIGSPLGNHGGALERIGSCVERSIGFTVVSNRLAVTIAAVEDLSSASDHIEWSPEVSLNVKGDTKPIVVLRSLAIVVINSTNCDLKCVPTDGRGNALVEDDNASVVSGCNAGWSVPVCLHKEAKKRSITADVSSWLSSKLSRRPSEDPSNSAKHALVARLSCSFRVSLVEDGYEWTEELAVLLPKISFLLSSDGKLRIAEPETSSSPTTNTQEGLYPAPSTTTYRRRLLIRHRGFRHKMLTYTMTQEGKSIHIMFFVDHQPPVIIHNQWGNMLGFRNMSFPSDPEGVGANFYLEYDWSLQVSAKHRKSIAEKSDTDDKKPNSESKLLSDWLEASSQSLVSADTPDTTTSERMRFQIGSPQFGWSNSVWQVGGIQFASFTKEEGSATAQPGPTFLVMCFYRAGSWLISITCLEDPMDGLANPTPSLVLPSVASPVKAEQTVPAFLKVGVVVEELSLHFCDEHDPLRDARGMILYPEILRATCNAVSMVFATAPDPPEVSRHSTRLGYLSHIRSYTTLLVAAEDIELGHFLQTCNFPVILHFPETYPSKNLLQFDRVKKHESLGKLMDKLLDKQLPGAEKACLITRVVYTDTWDPIGIPSYFHSIELKLSPAVLQVEDDILTYVNAFVRPILAAQEGEAVLRAMHENENRKIAPSVDAWSLHAYESAKVTAQRKVYVEWLEISNLQVTITARVSIPVLNSFDGTPLHFGSTEMREVFSFPDQLIKDLAADYVADTIVRSPVLLMSLNIIGNPAGFLRSFGQGVRDLVEIPLAASRNGYSPWILTKGVVGGVASFLGHTTAATLTSVSGFSYSISRTMDQLTLPPDQLRKRHYTRPTHLSSALADGLGSLGSSVVGAAAGVITTPIAVYKERQMQGLNTGIRNVVGGVGMGLVGIVARPMGGVASLVSMASDGLLYGMGGSRTPFDDSVSRFDARPNELLRYKLKVLPDAIGSSLIFAHGIWVIPEGNTMLVSEQELDYISEEQLETPENEPLQDLLLPRDNAHRLVQVTVVCSNECVYVVGVSGAQNQAVLARTSLKSIEAVEESLKEPTVLDLGIKTPVSVEWLRFRLAPRQRRHLSHQLRLWLAEDSIL